MADTLKVIGSIRKLKMIQSMTGFATTTFAIATPTKTAITATLTIKTLNNRFLDVSCKLPYALSYLETDILRICKEQLHRGSVYVTIHMNNQQALQSNVGLAHDLAKNYQKAIEELQTEFALPGTVTISDFLSLPNLFEATEQISLEESKQSVLEQIEQLLHKVVATRELEGAALEKDLEKRMQVIAENMQAIEPRAEQVNVERHAHFVTELKKALIAAQVEANESQLQALYNTFEKIDVHEEIVRFKNHRENFLVTLHDAQIQKGKKLDFILQELFREINTLSAKLTDAQASNFIIAIKVELEKAREQAQNLV
jgi:uncharacterized protein (TIGR00255 family)